MARPFGTVTYSTVEGVDVVPVGPRAIAAAVGVLAQGDLARFSTSGESHASRFESELARSFGVDHGLAVNSGTSALICALVGAGIGPGDEVLVPAYTWVSTAAAPLAVGAIPVLVEVDESLTIDLDDLARKVTPESRAILPVHMINLVCDMDAILEFARRHELVVIEDACQAIGVSYRGRATGSMGHAGAFSFNQHKNIKSGEGGALITNDTRLYQRAAMYHDVGSYEREGFDVDEPLFPGVNLRMPELSAAILRPQLRRLEAQIRKRKVLREIVLDAVTASPYSCRVSRHHDPDNAVGVAVWFDDVDEAVRFGANKGARRLIDTGRHVYTNWRSVIERRPVHPALDPYAGAGAQPEYDEHALPQTLDVLAHTCTVEIVPEIPGPAYRAMLKRALR